MRREIISTDKAPRTGGPYAQALRYGDLVFVSGQVAIDPNNGKVVVGDIRDQTKQVLENISALLKAAGTSLSNCLDAIVFLRDPADFDGYNEVYRSYFPINGPARVTAIAGNNRSDIKIQIRVIAAIEDPLGPKDDRESD